MMETFTAAIVSLTIAVSLIINKKKDATLTAYIAVCTAFFVWKAGAFLHELFVSPLWKTVAYLGLLAVAPALVALAAALFHGRTFIARRDVTVCGLFTALLVILLFTPLGTAVWFPSLIIVYTAAVSGVAYIALLAFIRHKAAGTERKRMIYLAVACAVAVLLSTVDFSWLLGLHPPPFSNLVLAALLYFALLIIAYPHLTELHELLARALVIAILTALATLAFTLIVGLFSKAVPPITHVLVASFAIVISITPIKVILKRIFAALYPESKDVFTSLYAFDERLERERSMLLEEMAPVLAHEVRNPLGAIKSAAQFLKSEARTEEDGNLLTIIIEEVDRLNGVVSQFLNYARPYALHLEEHDVNWLVRKALTLVRTSHLVDHITIEEDLRPDLPPVTVDAEQIIQVLLNIALNAVEAMPGGGTLAVRTARIESDTGEAVGITIRDTGKGMKKEELKNIFKPFFTTKERGTGLGLAICQRIIKNHGGRIRVRSLEGQGSIFFIRLDAARG